MRRIASVAAVAALLLAACGTSTTPTAGDWPQFHAGPNLQGHNTAELVLSVATVPHIGLMWTGMTAGSIDSSPVVAGGTVYVGTAFGRLLAYPVGCATNGGFCQPTWKGATNGAAIYSSAAVANGVVYINGAGSDGILYAYPVGCATGGALCQPLWTG
jgi:PQQ-like domain